MEHIFPSPLLTKDQGRHSRYRDRRIGHQHKIRERFGEEKQTYLEQQAATYLRQGLLIRENDTLTLSKKGIFISDGIMSDLLWV